METNKRPRGIALRRGQIFTADFIIATSLLVVGLGALLQSTQSAQTSAATRIQTYSGLSDPLAEMIAQNLAYNAPLNNNYCVRWGNGTDSCSGFNCDHWGGNLLATTRLARCTGTAGGYCLLSVYTCE